MEAESDTLQEQKETLQKQIKSLEESIENLKQESSRKDDIIQENNAEKEKSSREYEGRIEEIQEEVSSVSLKLKASEDKSHNLEENVKQLKHTNEELNSELTRLKVSFKKYGNTIILEEAL